jgi:hypothetical protein
MPWQQMVADIGGEIDLRTGLPAYREVIVCVPRQSGKTTLILSWEVQRANGWDEPQKIVYSAQSGNDARKKLIEDQVPILQRHRNALGITRILRGMGNEAIEFRNGSRLVLLSSSDDSGHGKTIDFGVKDELFADFDDRRDQALIPAMATKAAGQILTASTMGTEESVPLNRAVDRGRLAVSLGATEGIAYFEWSADPDADPADPNTWWSCMPALGYTISEPVVAHALNTMKLEEFKRAFLNLKTAADDRVIPIEYWVAARDDNAAPAGQISFGIDINPERSAGSIVAASQDVTELVEYRNTIGWIVPRAVELHERYPESLFVIDSKGPAASLIADLQGKGVNVHPATPQELVLACGQIYDAFLEGRARFRPHARFDEAAAGASKRTVGDAWAWTRKSAGSDISPLVAMTLARWAAQTNQGVSVYEERGLVTA